VVKLRIKFPNTPSGQAGGCTGSLIGSMHVLTAGHCVFNSSKGGWATAILVIPGADGVTTTGVSAGVFGTTFIKAPFGIAFAVAPLRSVKCWTQSGETPDCDYGLITLNKTFNVGAFGLLHLSDDDLDKTQAYIIGYPGELGSPPGLQEFFVPGGGTIWAYDSERVEYKIDVTSGNSGSPVYRFWNGNRAVFSIHTTSVSPFVGSDYNAGPRITTARYNQIRGWQCADAPCP
jgi:glutamyl endopeptidase